MVFEKGFHNKEVEQDQYLLQDFHISLFRPEELSGRRLREIRLLKDFQNFAFERNVIVVPQWPNLLHMILLEMRN